MGVSAEHTHVVRCCHTHHPTPHHTTHTTHNNRRPRPLPPLATMRRLQETLREHMSRPGKLRQWLGWLMRMLLPRIQEHESSLVYRWMVYRWMDTETHMHCVVFGHALCFFLVCFTHGAYYVSCGYYHMVVAFIKRKDTQHHNAIHIIPPCNHPCTP